MNATIHMFGQKFNVKLVPDRYANHALAVRVEDADTGEDFTVLSVNLPATDYLPRHAFYAKHWSENEGLPEQLLQQGLIRPVNAPAQSSGFVSNIRAYELVD